MTRAAAKKQTPKVTRPSTEDLCTAMAFIEVQSEDVEKRAESFDSRGRSDLAKNDRERVVRALRVLEWLRDGAR